MNENWSDARFDSIRRYVHADYRIDDRTIFLIDNMFLTQMAKVARESEGDFERFVRYFVRHDAVLLIPDIIFIESGANKGMTPERYRELYEPLFSRLSEMCPIYRVTFADMYGYTANGAVSRTQAFLLLQTLAAQIMRMNRAIATKVEEVKDVSGLEAAILSTREDRGERMLHLLGCALLTDGARQVVLLSNEDRGVYVVRHDMYRNERLLQLLYVERQTFLHVYRLLSLDCLLFDILREDMLSFSTDEKTRFIEKMRGGTHKNRMVRFVIDPDFSDKAQLETSRFVEYAENEGARINY